MRMKMVNTIIKDELAANNGKVNASTFDKIKTYLANRWRVSLNEKDMFLYTLKKIFCCCFLNGHGLNSSKRILSKTQKRSNLMRKGEEKIYKELDCISLMTRLRQLDLLVALFLSQQQKVLLHFSKRNLLREDNDPNTSSEEDTGGIQSYQTLIPKFKSDVAEDRDYWRQQM